MKKIKIKKLKVSDLKIQHIDEQTAKKINGGLALARVDPNTEWPPKPPRTIKLPNGQVIELY